MTTPKYGYNFLFQFTLSLLLHYSSLGVDIPQKYKDSLQEEPWQFLPHFVLLSYTKILCTVSYVLFFYSTITDLPSNKTTVVWSVDANVPLFGAKFIVLFTACLILLIIIIPFNVVLTFTRILSRHRTINYFKPLLDAYQGPYKNRYYFWPGLQLLVRAIFFGLSALDKNINLAIGLVLLAAMLGMYVHLRVLSKIFKSYFSSSIL